MAPTKNSITSKQQSLSKDAAAASLVTILPNSRKGTTRNKNVQDQNACVIQTRANAKRKAENSPIKNEKIKRSALGNLTNNANVLTTTTQHSAEDAKQKQQKLGKKVLGAINQVLKDTQNSGSGVVQQQKTKITTRAAAAAKNAKRSTTATVNNLKKNDNADMRLLPPPAPVAANASMAVMPAKLGARSTRRISNEFNQTEDSLYMSALEDVSNSESVRLSGNFDAVKRRSLLLQQQQQKEQQQKEEQQEQQKQKHEEQVDTIAADESGEKSFESDEDDGNYKDDLSFMIAPMPEGVEDFDKANWNDPFQVSSYAMDIFNYLKSRESQFIIDDYMVRQVHLSKWMRSLLVDWMVEVQETFELNHETLYLAVKIVDLFLCKEVIEKERLQLLGAAALFIACKYDERTPPLIEDFLYICDGAYEYSELVKMEMICLRTIDYDLGIPLSYRFLRRYARCAKVTMPTLTLARYALELSLMDYETTSLSDSRLACAALFIALRLHGEHNEKEKTATWTVTLEYYTGYKLKDFVHIVQLLNVCMHRKPKGSIKNIRNKYSHKIFHEVAKVSLMTTEKLLENDLSSNMSILNDTEDKNLEAI